MCGKDWSISRHMMTHPGSPPHVRERRFGSRDIVRTLGITPACAGKTQMTTMMMNKARDHPRMCGKDIPTAKYSYFQLGSPPHVRERPQLPAEHETKRRITPACAGKTTFAQKPLPS